jgi:hypothetical protein
MALILKTFGKCNPQTLFLYDTRTFFLKHYKTWSKNQ